MIFKEKFEQFTVYRSEVSNSFLYVNFSVPNRFMDGLSDYVLSETNLLNYANSMSPIAFTPTLYNGPVISDHRSKKYREHGKIQ